MKKHQGLRDGVGERDDLTMRVPIFVFIIFFKLQFKKFPQHSTHKKEQGRIPVYHPL
ncbi:MAG: hypothetical protein ACFFD4_12750 [Candidatus Odinarchaeota archaeon]